MKEIRSVCPYCGVGCGLLLGVDRGRIQTVRGDPTHPTNRGGLCAKGKRLAETSRPGDRLLRPLARPHRKAPLEPVTWPQAIAIVSAAIRRSVAEHGPGSVALYLSGQLLTEDYYAANKLGKGLIKTANVDTNSRLCMSSTVVAYKRAFGADGPPGCYEDLEAARDVFFWGSNAAETHPILFGRLLAARRTGQVHWTVVDPRRTPTALEGDEHLALRPGTDVALLLAMTGVMLAEGLVDEAAVRATCSGLEELREAAASMPVERAAAICELEPARIVTAARRFACSPAALSLWCQGLNQSWAGTDKVNAVINLHLLAGQIGRPGSGPLSLTGQANAMGGREVGAMATELAAHRGWEDAQDRLEIERFWGLGPLPKERGLTAVEMVEAIASGRVRVLWVAGSNPLASLPDGQAVRTAFERLELLVVSELYHPTDTTRVADVLLPSAGWAEKTGTLTSSERRVALAQQAIPPPGEARPDWAIFAAVGAALGAPRAFDWHSSAEVFAEHVRLTAGRDLDMSGLSHEVLRQRGPQQWPSPAGGHSQARRYLDRRYPTPDGRARLIAVFYREPAETPEQRFPLRLVTGRERDQWHTMSRTGRVAALRAQTEEVTLRLHPADVLALGLAEGGQALVSSPRGHLVARVRSDAAQRPGTVFLPFHLGPLLAPGGWTNALTSPALDPQSFQPELKHTVVGVRPVCGEVALAGGTLADAIAERLRRQGLRARVVTAEQLEQLPRGVQRALIATGRLAAARAWWEIAAKPPPPPTSGATAVLDLDQGPEPLVALPALQQAGWRIQLAGERWLPAAVAQLLRASLPAAGLDAPAVCLRVACPAACPAPAMAGVMVLQPGGELGLRRPLSGDPAILAAYLAGRSGVQAALRRLVVPLSPRRSLLVLGDPLGEPSLDVEQGVHLLVHEDRAAGWAQVWRLAAGQVLGGAAVLPPAVAEDAEALWLTDPDPALLRRRFPLR